MDDSLQADVPQADVPIKRVFRHSRWLLGAQLVTNMAAIVQAVVVTRTLGATSYGIYVLIVAYVTFVNNFFDSRVWQAISKFIPEFRAANRHDKAAAVFQFCVLVEAVAAVLAWIVVVTFGQWAVRHIPGSHESLIWLCALLPLINALAEPLRAMTRVAERFAWLTVHATAVAVIQTAGVGAIWFFGATIERVLLVQIVASTAAVLLLFALAAPAARKLGLPLWKMSLLSSLRGDFRRVSKFLVFTNLTATSAVVDSVDRLLLALFVSPAAVGAYDLARKIVQQLNRLVMPVHRAVFHEMSAMIATRRFREVSKLQRQMTGSLASVVVPVCAAVTLAAPTAIPAVFGADYAPAGVVLQILIWQLLKLPLAWVRGFMLCIDRAGIMMCVKWSHTVLLVVLMLLLIPPLGIIGASWASLICTVLWIAVAVLLLRHFSVDFLLTSNDLNPSKIDAEKTGTGLSGEFPEKRAA